MTDQGTEGARRRWHATGALDDGVDYLTRRLRAGDLDDDRLRIAAHCGDAAARQVLIECARRWALPVPPPSPRPGAVERVRFALAGVPVGEPVAWKALDPGQRERLGALRAWVERLALAGSHGKAACIRAAASAARRALDDRAAPERGPGREGVARALEWLRCPCPAHETGAYDLHLLDDEADPLRWAERAGWAAGAVRAARTVGDVAAVAAMAAEAAAMAAGLDPSEAAMRDDLLLWALGEGDPLLDAA
ncbi:MAG: hypothetical protein M9894_29950 [Planctomycetes bacterium]|nr:hypothetical protein [Planctomycetota bacterium]